MKKTINYTLIYFSGESEHKAKEYTGPYEDVVNDIISGVDRKLVENIVFHPQ